MAQMNRPISAIVEKNLATKKNQNGKMQQCGFSESAFLSVSKIRLEGSKAHGFRK